jgi:tetratricopeptide (TPR) repeat protein
LLEQVLKLRKRSSQPREFSSTATITKLAQAYRERGRLDELIRLCKEESEWLRRKLGPDDWLTLHCVHTLAHAYLDAGQAGNALDVFRKLGTDNEASLELAVDRYGLEHPETLEAADRLAHAWAICPVAQLSDARRAVELAERTTKRFPKSPRYRETLGAARYRAGDYEDAIAHLSFVVAMSGGDVAGNAFAELFLAMAHARLGDMAKAREHFARSTAWKEHFGPGDAARELLRREAAQVLGINHVAK